MLPHRWRPYILWVTRYQNMDIDIEDGTGIILEDDTDCGDELTNNRPLSNHTVG
ncbi:hypothetical protein HSBGL_4102 (plasmid) [Halapricum desulfuricans]|uniref:Uncharacterized protein n=1 Tax=Halapricum desulfuricans TaxID=2841257 RepID=A0A897NTL9_9EURY|nr:hypothetical protein HSBGL_4102 [Halapricum desulfuricans]